MTTQDDIDRAFARLTAALAAFAKAATPKGATI